MRIARPGWGPVGLGLVAAAAGCLPMSGGAGWAAVGAGLAFAGLCAFFYRDPERPLPSDEGRIYSPGDGRVLSVRREGPGDVVTIRIFLSPFDVHVQRAPCSGLVEKVRYQPGGFVMAMREEADRNERNVVGIAPGAGRGTVVVEQIAGFLARRIECWTREGDRLRAGERYGMIHFGSQAAVHLPAGARPVVRPGDRVAAGVTAVGEWTG